MTRLFLAVPLADETRDAIEAWLPRLPGRAVPPRNWHLTLRFLGDVSDQQRDGLVRVLEDTELGAPIRLVFDRLGAFPRDNRARVLWLGIEEGAPQLVELAARVEECVRGVGFTAEDKPFVPHLTLSRLKPPQNLAPLIQSSTRCGVEMMAREVVLYRSVLGEGAARYEAVRFFVLSPASGHGN